MCPHLKHKKNIITMEDFIHLSDHISGMHAHTHTHTHTHTLN